MLFRDQRLTERRARLHRWAVPAGRFFAAVWMMGSGVVQAGTGTEARVQTGVEYHSNAFLSDGTINEIEPGLSVLLKPQLGYARDEGAHAFNVRGSWSLRKYLDVRPDNAFITTNLDRWRDMDVDGNFDLRRESAVGFRANDHFEVISTPAELATAEEGTNANIRLTSNDLRGGLVFRPSSEGSALEAALLGNYGLDRYDVPDVLAASSNANINNRTNYGPVLDVRWRFLPRTSLVGRASVNWLDWENNLVSAVGADVAAPGTPYGSFIGKPDASKWHVGGGLRGQVTDRLAAVVELGFGQMTYDETSVATALGAATEELALVGDENYARDLETLGEGITTNLMVKYALGSLGDQRPRHTVGLSYKKDFQDAFFTNYNAFNNFSAQYTGNFGEAIVVDLEGTFRLDGYHGEIARTDAVFRVRSGLSWQPSKDSPLGVALGAGWNERACADAECEGGGYYGVQYDDFYGTFGVSYTRKN